VLALPYLVWLTRADTLALAALAGDRGFERPGLALGGTARRPCCLAISGIVLLVAFNGPLVRPQPGGGADHLFGRRSMRWARAILSISFAIGPALAGSLVAGLPRSQCLPRAGPAIVLLMFGLAAIVANGRPGSFAAVSESCARSGRPRVIAACVPGGRDHAVSGPGPAAAEVADVAARQRRSRVFFGDSFERRTNHRLAGR